MKINQVEQLVGITKKNIRFYEEQGLLTPRRNRENGYREYGEDDVRTLEQIKLFRKLGLPIEEIRKMQSGRATVSDCMKRHLVTLARERENIGHSEKMCNILKDSDINLAELNAEKLLLDMENLEKRGASFKNIDIDVKAKRYIGAFAASMVIILAMVGLFALFAWSYINEPEEMPVAVFIILMLVPAAIILGVMISLVQRVREIRKGEVDDARKF